MLEKLVQLWFCNNPDRIDPFTGERVSMDESIRRFLSDADFTQAALFRLNAEEAA